MTQAEAQALCDEHYPCAKSPPQAWVDTWPEGLEQDYEEAWEYWIMVLGGCIMGGNCGMIESNCALGIDYE